MHVQSGAEHREVRLAACGRERGHDVVLAAGGRRDPDELHAKWPARVREPAITVLYFMDALYVTGTLLF